MDPTKVKKEGAGSFNWWVKSVHPLNTYCMLTNSVGVEMERRSKTMGTTSPTHAADPIAAT
jgi:hypothetical protein